MSPVQRDPALCNFSFWTSALLQVQLAQLTTSFYGMPNSKTVTLLCIMALQKAAPASMDVHTAAARAPLHKHTVLLLMRPALSYC